MDGGNNAAVWTSVGLWSLSGYVKISSGACGNVWLLAGSGILGTNDQDSDIKSPLRALSEFPE